MPRRPFTPQKIKNARIRRRESSSAFGRISERNNTLRPCGLSIAGRVVDGADVADEAVRSVGRIKFYAVQI